MLTFLKSNLKRGPENIDLRDKYRKWLDMIESIKYKMIFAAKLIFKVRDNSAITILDANFL